MALINRPASHWRHLVSLSGTIGAIGSFAFYALFGAIVAILLPQPVSAQGPFQYCYWGGDPSSPGSEFCYVDTRVCNQGDFDVFVALAFPETSRVRNTSYGWFSVRRNQCEWITNAWSFGLTFMAVRDGEYFNIELDKDEGEIIYDDKRLFSSGKTSGKGWDNSNGFICVSEDYSGFETRFDTWAFDAACDQGFMRTPLSNWIAPRQRTEFTKIDLKIRPKWSQARAMSGYRASLNDGVHVVTLDDGSRYEGEIKNDRRNGHGVMTWVNGDRYDGEWKDGERTGRGVITWASGSRYDGEWKDDRANGHGVMTWASGDEYDGEWKDDERTGRGVMVLASGDGCDGEWRDGKLVGTGTGIQNQLPKPCYPQEYRFTFDQP